MKMMMMMLMVMMMKVMMMMVMMVVVAVMVMMMMLVVMMMKKVMMMMIMVVMMMKKKKVMILEVQAGSIWGYKQDTAPACSHCWHGFFLQLFFCSPPAFCWNWTGMKSALRCVLRALTRHP